MARTKRRFDPRARPDPLQLSEGLSRILTVFEGPSESSNAAETLFADQETTSTDSPRWPLSPSFVSQLGSVKNTASVQDHASSAGESQCEPQYTPTAHEDSDDEPLGLKRARKLTSYTLPSPESLDKPMELSTTVTAVNESTNDRALSPSSVVGLNDMDTNSTSRTCFAPSPKTTTPTDDMSDTIVVAPAKPIVPRKKRKRSLNAARMRVDTGARNVVPIVTNPDKEEGRADDTIAAEQQLKADHETGDSHFHQTPCPSRLILEPLSRRLRSSLKEQTSKYNFRRRKVDVSSSRGSLNQPFQVALAGSTTSTIQRLLRPSIETSTDDIHSSTNLPLGGKVRLRMPDSYFSKQLKYDIDQFYHKYWHHLSQETMSQRRAASRASKLESPDETSGPPTDAPFINEEEEVTRYDTPQTLTRREESLPDIVFHFKVRPRGETLRRRHLRVCGSVQKLFDNAWKAYGKGGRPRLLQYEFTSGAPNSAAQDSIVQDDDEDFEEMVERLEGLVGVCEVWPLSVD